MKRRFLILTALLLALPSGAQEFGRFRPMYFIGGTPLQGPVNKSTVNLKFQLSMSISLWQEKDREQGLDLSFGYSQISVWDCFDKSSPFRDNAFIPGLYLTVPLEKNRLIVGFEHRSNGRPMRGTQGDTGSRSANYLFGKYMAFLPGGLSLSATLRAGFGNYEAQVTQEIFSRFLGYADFGVGYRSPDGNWELRLEATPLFGPFDMNMDASIAYHLGACALFAQLNSGYGEALSDWVRGFRPAPYLRVGILVGELLR